jgi:hypothetical protein
MKKRVIGALAGLVAAASLDAQTISFGLGDSAFEASLNEIGASAKLDMPGFTAEVSLQWGVSAEQVNAAVSQGFRPAEVYLAAGLASVSGKPLAVVVQTYEKNKAKGWGAIAKELGIKPGSKEFKSLKDKSAASSGKLKKGKKK